MILKRCIVVRLLTAFSGRVGSLHAATQELEVGQKDWLSDGYFNKHVFGY